MNASKFFAAVTVFAVAGSTFAADLPASSNATTSAAIAAAANASAAASKLNVPTITIGNPQARSRAEVRAEAVEFVKNHKTAFAMLMEHSKK